MALSDYNASNAFSTVFTNSFYINNQDGGLVLVEFGSTGTFTDCNFAYGSAGVLIQKAAAISTCTEYEYRIRLPCTNSCILSFCHLTQSGGLVAVHFGSTSTFTRCTFSGGTAISVSVLTYDSQSTPSRNKESTHSNHLQ
jgi:hypothetical protein